MSMICRVALPPPRTSRPQSAGAITRGANRLAVGDRHSAISVVRFARTSNVVRGGRYTACG